MKYDRLTQSIHDGLNRIPWIGECLSFVYLWHFSFFNFMLVGASGMVLSWILYEGMFRVWLQSVFGGTFLAMLITTTLVFFWNYLLNKRFSFKLSSQLLSMTREELFVLQKMLHEKLES